MGYDTNIHIKIFLTQNGGVLVCLKILQTVVDSKSKNKDNQSYSHCGVNYRSFSVGLKF